MELSTYVAHPGDGALSSRQLLAVHFCPEGCPFQGDSKRCLRYFYTKSNPTIMETDIFDRCMKGWKPALDEVERILCMAGDDSWYEELINYIDAIKSTRNPNYDTFKDTTVFTVDLSTMKDNEIEDAVARFLSTIESANVDIPMIIPLVFQGDCVANQERSTYVSSLPEKIMLGNGDKCYLEILVPLLDSEEGVFINTDVALHPALRTLFRTQESDKIFLVHDGRSAVLKIEYIMRSLKNGDMFEVERFLDTALLWTRYGGYARDEFSLRFMYKYITGGIHLAVNDKEKEGVFQKRTEECDTFLTVNAFAELKIMLNLYMVFFVVTIPTLFPSKHDTMNNITLWSPSQFIRHFILSVTESCCSIDFDYKRYLVSPPKHRYWCGGDKATIDERVYIKEFRYRCSRHRTRLSSTIDSIWPRNIDIITRGEWSKYQKCDVTLLWQICEARPLLANYSRKRVSQPAFNIRIRESRSLLEILNYLNDDRTIAWKILRRKLDHMPELLLRWIENSSPIGRYNPEAFTFGSTRNYKKIIALAKEFYPGRSFPNPHRQLHCYRQDQRF